MDIYISTLISVEKGMDFKNIWINTIVIIINKK